MEEIKRPIIGRVDAIKKIMGAASQLREPSFLPSHVVQPFRLKHVMETAEMIRVSKPTPPMESRELVRQVEALQTDSRKKRSAGPNLGIVFGPLLEGGKFSDEHRRLLSEAVLHGPKNFGHAVKTYQGFVGPKVPARRLEDLVHLWRLAGVFRYFTHARKAVRLSNSLEDVLPVATYLQVNSHRLNQATKALSKHSDRGLAAHELLRHDLQGEIDRLADAFFKHLSQPSDRLSGKQEDKLDSSLLQIYRNNFRSQKQEMFRNLVDLCEPKCVNSAFHVLGAPGKTQVGNYFRSLCVFTLLTHLGFADKQQLTQALAEVKGLKSSLDRPTRAAYYVFLSRMGISEPHVLELLQMFEDPKSKYDRELQAEVAEGQSTTKVMPKNFVTTEETERRQREIAAAKAAKRNKTGGRQAGKIRKSNFKSR